MLRVTRWKQFAPAAGVLISFAAGCGPAYHIRRIGDASLDKRRISDVRALANYPKDAQATEALIAATEDADAAVRFFAVEALEMHIARGRGVYTDRIVAAWVDRLEDDASGGYTIFFPGLPVGWTAVTGSVRARALLALTGNSGPDLGFDRAKWVAYFERTRKRPLPPAQAKGAQRS